MKNNPERNRERAKAWYEANKERAKATRKAHYEANKEKYTEMNKAWRAENQEQYKEAQRRHSLKTKYGITVEEYDEMFAKQDGKCLLCFAPETDENKLHVDHCHTTMKVRGLLCGHCNKALGLFRDNPEALERAATYLRGEIVYG